MGQFGLTQSELERFGAALVTDSEQLAAMGDQLAHGEQLTHLMETVACEHTFMDPATAHEATVPPRCPNFSELRGRGDGVFMRPRRLDAVDAAARDA